ncbi:MAG TPA: RDD family protein [Candidatus Bathyarchaeia archaeon]|nr:RDD family protein [Candidatus Bathyarchaeia archaeon]
MEQTPLASSPQAMLSQTQVPSVVPPQQLQVNPAPPSSPAMTIMYASFKSRFLASLIDGIILVVINFVITIVSKLPFIFLSESSSENYKIIQSLVSMVSSIIAMLINSGYFVYFIGSKGQTLGKKALKIKVISINTHQPPGYSKAFIRECVGKVFSAVFCLGYLWMLWDKEKQAWHDKLAKTIVIKL